MSTIDNFTKENLRDMDKYYIWKCPNLGCNAKGVVLFKTKLLDIGDGKIMCGICNKIYKFEEIRIANSNNFSKYLEIINKKKNNL